MSPLTQLDALNPVPEYQGNPGPYGLTRNARTKRLLALGGVLAGAALVIVIGALAIGQRPRGPIEVEVAGQGQAESPGAGQGIASVVPTPTAAPEPSTPAVAAPAGTVAIEDDAVVVEALARLIIPAIDLDKMVVEGVSTDALRKGPGHYIDSAIPGQSGNAAIAGHRTTFGSPFHRLDELAPGDQIFVITMQGAFEYAVREQTIVDPQLIEVLDDQSDNRLTLTTEHPKFSSAQRLVIVADLIGDPSPSVEPALLPLVGSPGRTEILTEPYFSDEAFRGTGQPYFSFAGNEDPVVSARVFLGSQFGDWAEQVEVSIHEITSQSASVRWHDRANDTSGWIILALTDGRYVVWDMTTDGVTADLSFTSTGGRGLASSDRAVAVSVFRPIGFWMDSDDPTVVAPDPAVNEPLVDVMVAGGDPQILEFVAALDDRFGEVRLIIRDEGGEQIGGAISSLLLPPVRTVGVVAAANETTRLLAFVETQSQVMAAPIALDPWQSALILASIAPDLGPADAAETPENQLTTLALRPVVEPNQLGEQLALIAQLASFGHVVGFDDAQAVASAPEFEAPPSAYVADRLPSVDHCQGFHIMGWARPVVTINEDRQVYPTPQAALASGPPSVQAADVSFTSPSGELLGFGARSPDDLWLFLTVAQVEPVEDGWVLAGWSTTGC